MPGIKSPACGDDGAIDVRPAHVLGVEIPPPEFNLGGQPLGAAMPFYRCHFLDSADYIVMTKIVDCETDADMRETADLLLAQIDYPVIEIWDCERQVYRVRKIDMSGDLIQLRRSVPDLAHLDPLSTEVQDWLDRAYDAVNRVDQAEGVILRMHQRYLLNPGEKTVASAEIVDIVDRVVRTSAIMKRAGVARVDRTRSNA